MAPVTIGAEWRLGGNTPPNCGTMGKQGNGDLVLFFCLGMSGCEEAVVICFTSHVLDSMLASLQDIVGEGTTAQPVRWLLLWPAVLGWWLSIQVVSIPM